MRRSISLFVGLLLAMGSMAAFAAGDTFLNSRYERTPYRAMGGVDITIDSKNPTVAALSTRGEVTIFNIDIYGTLSEGIRAYENLYTLWELDWNFDFENRQDFEEFADEIRDVSENITGDQLTLVARVLLDVGHTVFTAEQFSMQFGLYSRALGGARFRTPPQIELEGTGNNTRINFGERTRVARAGSILDAGLFLAPGGFFSASDSVHIGFGGRVRGFYRLQLPPHEVTVDAIVDGTGDVEFPREIDEEHGAGIGVDVYSTIHFGEDTDSGFRIGVLAEDLITWVGSADLENYFVTPRLGLGASYISQNERGVVGVDLERIATGDPTLQVGGSYRVGPAPANFTLAGGALLNERDIEGTELDPALTTGFQVHLGVLNLGAVFEYQFGREAFNAGVSFGFGWKGQSSDDDELGEEGESVPPSTLPPRSPRTTPTDTSSSPS